MVAAALVKCMFPGTLSVQTKLTGGTSIAQGLFIEMFLTAELLLTVLFLAAEKSKVTFIAPVGIGLALFVAELTGLTSSPSSHHTGSLNWLTDNFRRLLYRRFSQPSQVFRSRRCQSTIRRVSDRVPMVPDLPSSMRSIICTKIADWSSIVTITSIGSVRSSELLSLQGTSSVTLPMSITYC